MVRSSSYDGGPQQQQQQQQQHTGKRDILRPQQGIQMRRAFMLMAAVTILAYRYESLVGLSRSLRSDLEDSYTNAKESSGDSASSYDNMILPSCSDDNHHNDNDTANSIQSYLSLMEHPDDWVLLKWKPDGTFDQELAQTECHYPQWLASSEILGDAEPSAFGRIVLLLNSDRLPLVPWHVIPPVPVWLYSMPRSDADPRDLNVTDLHPKRCQLSDMTVVPTPYDAGNWNKNCVETVLRQVQAQNFTDKINAIVWRGVIHSDRVEQSRVAVLELAKAAQDTTTTFLDIQQVNPKSQDNRKEMHELAEYRYHLDLGGLSGTAWGGLRWKLCSGLLVFKVDSWADDWWYGYLEPWKHYIPVRADVSDLIEHYRWTQEHPEETLQIVEAGRQKCLETLGPDKAQAHYRTIVQQIPAAEASVMEEANMILQKMKQHQAGLSQVIPLITAEE